MVPVVHKLIEQKLPQSSTGQGKNRRLVNRRYGNNNMI